MKFIFEEFDVLTIFRVAAATVFNAGIFAHLKFNVALRIVRYVRVPYTDTTHHSGGKYLSIEYVLDTLSQFFPKRYSCTL